MSSDPTLTTKYPLLGLGLITAGLFLIAVTAIAGFLPCSEETWLHYRSEIVTGLGVGLGVGLGLVINGVVCRYA